MRFRDISPFFAWVSSTLNPIMLAFPLQRVSAMDRNPFVFFALAVFFLVAIKPALVSPAEPRVQILSPADGSRITQDQNSIFVSGKVARETGRSANVDIFLVID